MVVETRFKDRSIKENLEQFRYRKLKRIKDLNFND